MPLFTKGAYYMVHTFLVHMHSKFGGSYMTLSDSHTEFKNMFFMQVASTLGMEQVFSSPYYP